MPILSFHEKRRSLPGDQLLCADENAELVTFDIDLNKSDVAIGKRVDRCRLDWILSYFPGSTPGFDAGETLSLPTIKYRNLQINQSSGNVRDGPLLDRHPVGRERPQQAGEMRMWLERVNMAGENSELLGVLTNARSDVDRLSRGINQKRKQIALNFHVLALSQIAAMGEFWKDAMKAVCRELVHKVL